MTRAPLNKGLRSCLKVKPYSRLLSEGSENMKVGFTGSQVEPRPNQLAFLEERLISLGATEFHHGDCIGADAAAHIIATRLNIWTVGHPPSNPIKRAFCQFDEIMPEAPYLDRNKNIVRCTQYLIALPKGPEELRSGTWSTVRFARKLHVPVEFKLPE